MSLTLSMVIRTEYRGQCYSMGSSDPLPAGFEIRFGVLNFQATGNGYLMRLTNREELCAHQVAPLQRQHPPARTLRVHRRHGAAAAPASTRVRRGRSAGMQRVSPRNAMRPPAQLQLPRRGSARSPDHAFPSVCAAPRRPTPPTLASTRRCEVFPLAATFLLPGTLAPPSATSRP
jgi:hypothetical protein